MDIIIAADYDEASTKAAEITIAQLKQNPQMTLGLATGSTPMGLYRRLIEEYQKGGLDFSQITTFNLDEYVGLGPEHEQSYRYYMDNNLFSHINIPCENTHVPDGLASDLEACCRQYEASIASCGGIDLQILGIGRDGHIGFNEPGSSLGSPTRVAVLAPETIEDNSRFFSSAQQVPRFAISMGLRTILDARHCLLLATGKNKAEAVKECIEGPVSAMAPASVLQMHPHTTIIMDEAAASGLQRLNYYRWVQKGCEQLASAPKNDNQ